MGGGEWGVGWDGVGDGMGGFCDCGAALSGVVYGAGDWGLEGRRGCGAEGRWRDEGLLWIRYWDVALFYCRGFGLGANDSIFSLHGDIPT